MAISRPKIHIMIEYVRLLSQPYQCPGGLAWVTADCPVGCQPMNVRLFSHMYELVQVTQWPWGPTLCTRASGFRCTSASPCLSRVYCAYVHAWCERIHALERIENWIEEEEALLLLPLLLLMLLLLLFSLDLGAPFSPLQFVQTALSKE